MGGISAICAGGRRYRRRGKPPLPYARPSQSILTPIPAHFRPITRKAEVLYQGRGIPAPNFARVVDDPRRADMMMKMPFRYSRYPLF